MLDVENGKLCYIIGTIYMDMALKPNVLEDLAREVSSASLSSAESTELSEHRADPPPAISHSTTSLRHHHDASFVLETMRSCWRTRVDV